MSRSSGGLAGRLSKTLGGLSVVAAILLFAGCTVPDNTPTAEPTPLPVFHPDGTAQENQPYFDAINRQTIVSAPADSTALLQAIVAAGFNKTAMSSTADRTSVDLQADSVEIAIRMGESCLIGQWRPSDNGYQSVVTAPLEDGACLVGATRQIDW